MIKKDDLIGCFETMLREHWAYEWGAAKSGLVDCSGAFVYAYKALGGPSIPHGSNSILRQSMTLPLLPMSQAKPGYAAVKIRQDGEEPDRYKGDGIGNAYHIGLVGRDGSVLNAQSTATGFVSSAAGWAGCAPLKAVDYSEEGEESMEDALYQAVVTTQSTSLNLRDAPDGKKTGSLPRGATVDVLEESGGKWLRVSYEGKTGYASAAYLVPVHYRPPAEIEEDDTIIVSPDITIIDGAGRTFKPEGGWRVIVGSTD